MPERITLQAGLNCSWLKSGALVKIQIQNNNFSKCQWTKKNDKTLFFKAPVMQFWHLAQNKTVKNGELFPQVPGRNFLEEDTWE